MTHEEHAAVIARGAALSNALRPFGDEDVAAVESCVAAMLGGFRSMRQTGEDAETMVTVTRAVLRRRGFPLWAIEDACLRIASKETKHVQYAPNDAEIAEVVEGLLAPYARALGAVKKLLDAVPEHRAEKAKVEPARPRLPPPMTEERRRALNEDLAARKKRNDERKPDAAEK